MKRKHPIQNIHIDEHGIKRFVSNKIVDWLVDQIPGGLNTIARKFREDDSEDYEQLMMLIGYSLSGAWDLTYTNTVKPSTMAAAERKKIT